MTAVRFDTRWFFDRPAVTRAVDRQARRALSRIGAIVRRSARTSIKTVAPTKGMRERAASSDARKRARALQTIRRRQARTSAPGQPPLSHTRNRTRSIRNILFAFDPVRKSVVVGPVKLNQVQQSAIDTGSKTVPEILEFGDSVIIQEKSTDNGRTWRRRDMRRNPRPWEKYRRRRANVRARPFMEPALRREAPQFSTVFAKAA